VVIKLLVPCAAVVAGDAEICELLFAVDTRPWSEGLPF
jgi:hypothetical protein